MRKYIKNIMSAWHAGKKSASSGCGCSYSGKCSMTLDENVIYSYVTPIAYIKDGVMYLNGEKYSRTTSRQQSDLAYCASHYYGLKLEYVTESELRDNAKRHL
jgi:hypothetical protein